MANINKPNMESLWASEGAIIAPSESKVQQGWTAEIPPHQWENYIQNRQDTYIAYLGQHGVPEWDNITEYQAGKSFIQSGGFIWKALTTNSNIAPIDGADWVRFGFTSSEVANGYVAKTSATGSAKIPTGTTAQRDNTPSVGWQRFNTTTGKPEVWNGSVWTGLGDIVDADVLHKTGDETKSGVLTLTDSPIIPNATAGNQALALGQLTGFIYDFSGTTAPFGYLACPLAPTNISRTTYAKLFAAIGTTWGAGNGTTTFGIPWFPAGQVGVQANGNVGTSTVGQVISHGHSTGIRDTGGGSLSQVVPYSYNGGDLPTTGLTGGTANLPAGNSVLKCVQYL